MKSFTGFACSLAAAVSIAACGGNEFIAASDDAGGASGTLTDDQACGDNAHAHCLKIQTCSATLMATTFGDEGTCETRLQLLCLNNLSAPSTGGSARKTEACAQAYAAWKCVDYLDNRPPSPCLQALGGLTSGQPCGAPGQCQTGFCVIAPGSACGVCGPAPQPGASCAALTTCGQLLVCDSAVQQCAALATSGAACSRGQPCGAGLFCVGVTATARGTCQPVVEWIGAACDPLGKTGPGCDRLAGLTCNGASKQCASIQLAATGQACGVVGNQLALCASAGTCALSTGADASTSETCTPTADDGAPCDFVNGPLCRDPARCISNGDGGTGGTCQFANPVACH